MSLELSGFGEFYLELHGKTPFPWQLALMGQIWEKGEWPAVIDLPTGTGKTSCIDIALYAMAAGRANWRRIFYVVDRRILVSDVFERSRTIASKLKESTGGVLREVRMGLEALGGRSGLRVCELRGGIYLDRSWVADPLQPMVIASTVDQVGSRLLFRGYGVPSLTAPIHAAMVGQDSLILLDEAHCSKAFAETLRRVSKYQGWRREEPISNLQFVEMTATPATQVEEEKRFRLTDEDEEFPYLRERLTSAKIAELKEVPKGKLSLAEALAREAVAISDGKATAVMVNRVRTARETYEALGQLVGFDSVTLLIGRMRPLDAQLVHKGLEAMKTGAPREEARGRYVVATQCLEVGADLDFDALVTECASIDALQQRFGRLDRIGRMKGKARASILCAQGDAEAKEPDAVYGDCLKNTWTWLKQLALDGKVDFALRPGSGVPHVASALREGPAHGLRREGKDACVLLPAHLDALCQTAPRPHVDPDVSLFLHGEVETQADVQVVWRVEVGAAQEQAKKEGGGNFSERAKELLIEALKICPPAAAEALPVRIWDLRGWLIESEFECADADLEGLELEAPEKSRRQNHQVIDAFVWRGEESFWVERMDQIRPGDTVLVDVSQSKNLSYLGHIPKQGLSGEEGRVKDYGDEVASQQGKLQKRILKGLSFGNEEAGVEGLIGGIDAADGDIGSIRALVEESDAAGSVALWGEKLRDLKKADRYLGGYLLRGPRKETDPNQSSMEEDAGVDCGSFGRTDTLIGHTKLVEKVVERFAGKLLPEHLPAYREAARWHDVGKADLRFQTMLCQGDRLKAEMLREEQMLAKSSYRSFERGELPKDFRHEMVSLEFAERFSSIELERDLMLHLVASHHGHARPFAPYSKEVERRKISFGGHALERNPDALSHRLDSGCGERFWELTRRFNWWGLAYLETVFRLSDWKASQDGEEGKGNAS